MRILVEVPLHPAGNQYEDVTEAVQIIYDALMGSMDYGSGFLDTDEKRAMRRLAKVTGFEEPQFEDDSCYDCGHERQWHYADGCHTTVITKQAVYDRKMLTRPVKRLSDEAKTRMAEAMKLATTPQEVLLIVAGAAAMEEVVEEQYEGTIVVSPEEKTRCDCVAFK